MQLIQLANIDHRTTRLGFGSAHLIGTISRGRSLALLEQAFDAGVRHFDTAPMYGFGDAEACVGEFYQCHRNENLTIATKFGIPPGPKRRIFRMARAIGAPLLRTVRQTSSTPRPLASAPPTEPSPQSSPRLMFCPEQAARSLDASLRALKTEHIHLWLLHEATVGDLRDVSLLQFCDDAVRAGKIGTFGIGSDRAKIPAVGAEYPAFCRVVQHQWSLVDVVPKETASFRIHHGAFAAEARAKLVELCSDLQECRRCSEAVGADLSDRQVTSKLLLKCSLVMNPQSVILFASRHAEHVRANCSVADDASLDGPARRLFELVHAQIGAGLGDHALHPMEG